MSGEATILRMDRRAAVALGAAAIVVAAALAYLNSFAGVFLYDDVHAIVESPRVQSFAGVWGNRPLVALTLAVNYRLGGLDVAGYHLVNLAVHALAGLALFGVVRRTLLLERFGGRWASGAHWFALAVALVWVVHPIQTESVTYVIQRAESMMGLFYLLTLYCLIRGATAARGWPWLVAAVVACGLGMASKPVIVTAPAVALLYDRVFLAGSFRAALRRRFGLYAGLASTWLLIVATGTLPRLLDFAPEHPTTAGFGYDGAGPLAYLLTQPGVILHYLRLSLWPHPLCLDYDWPIARSAGSVLGPALVIAALLASSLWALRRGSWLGFAGLSFFVILAPTSSVVPFAHAAFEHRMYLPLAAVVVTALAAGHAGLRYGAARWAWSPAAVRWTGGAAVAVLVAVCGALTIDRNRDYHSAFAMWQDVLLQNPDNSRAYNQLANLAAEAGLDEQAISLYRQALRVNPLDHVALDNLANVLLGNGRTEEAVRVARTAVRLFPQDPRLRRNLGNALIAQDDFSGGVAELARAVELKPNDPWNHAALGRGLALEAERLAAAEARRARERAVGHLVEALRLRPGFAEAERYLADVLARHGAIDATVARYEGEVPLRRAHSLAWLIAGERRYRDGRIDEARQRFRRALAIDPANDLARRRLEAAVAAAPAD